MKDICKMLIGCAFYAIPMGLLLSQKPAGKPTPKGPPAPGKPVNRDRPANYKPYLNPRKIEMAKTLTYHRDHGKRFKYGWWYHGHSHPHWSHHYWDNRYGAYLYFDPGVQVWYWWCTPHYRFYPVTYLPVGLTYSSDYVENPKPPAQPPPAPPPLEEKP